MTAIRPNRRKRRWGHRPDGFTLVELLIVVAIIALLLSILLPSLQGARAQAQTTVCAANIRQLALANIAYASEQQGRYCAGAAGIKLDNLHRWHGVRPTADVPFDPQYGPLVDYLTAAEGIRACPAFRGYLLKGAAAFERGCGGFGYNQAYLGREMRRRPGASFQVVTDGFGVLSERVRRPAETLMFADAAFVATADGVSEYSFAEPRFHPEYLQYHVRMDPSIHFRHRGRVNIAWCDGHVDRQRLTFTYKSGVYLGNPADYRIGWFGPDDDNGLFDLE